MSSSNGPSQKISSEDIKLRGSLLAKNKELLKLHKELVFGGLLSEEQFWETRQGLLRAQEATLKQKRGLSAALAASEEAAKPVTGTTGTGDIKYVLTPAIIKGIFEAHPILKKAFTTLVKTAESSPETATTLTEKEFWIEYFKSKFFNEKAAAASASAGSALLDPYYETEAREKKSSEESSNSLEQFSEMVDESVDVSRSVDDRVSSDYVQLESDAMRKDPHWNAIRQFNLHSLKILQTCKPVQKSPGNLLERFVEISDLQAASEPALATLNIQEEAILGRRNYSKMDVDADVANEQIKRTLLSESAKAQSREHFVSYSSFKESMNSILARNHFTSANQQRPLQIDVTEELSHLMNASLEVLRHFWRTVAIPNAAERTAKLPKMFHALEQMEAKVTTAVNASAHSKQAMYNLLQVFQVARLKYNELCK